MTAPSPGPTAINPDLYPILYTADTLYTGLGGARSLGGVVVMRGLIVAAGDPGALRERYPHAQEVLVGGIIAPPPVNAHTHLDMSAYQFQARPYFRWIPEVAVAQSERRGAAGARLGADTLARLHQPVGDIAWTEEVAAALLPREDLSGVVYLEVLGPKPEQAAERFARLRAAAERLRPLERSGGLRLGLSPHATYTVSAPLMRRVAEYAAGEGLPLQIHVAEHPAEAELFASGGGPIWEHRLPALYPAHFAEVIGRPPAPDLTPLRYLDELGVLRAQPVLVHMVQVTEEDIQRTAAAGCRVVTCPRSNAYLQCGRFRWSAFAAQGIDIALGTDSVASGETLDMRDEVAFAQSLYPELDGREVVRAAVKGGARVLGLPAAQLRRGDPWRDEYIWNRSE